LIWKEEVFWKEESKEDGVFGMIFLERRRRRGRSVLEMIVLERRSVFGKKNQSVFGMIVFGKILKEDWNFVFGNDCFWKEDWNFVC
jgi:hypothetical protein